MAVVVEVGAGRGEKGACDAGGHPDVDALRRRCSPERAAAILAALPEAERASLPPVVDVTCHMCGRTCLVPRDAS